MRTGTLRFPSGRVRTCDGFGHFYCAVVGGRAGRGRPVHDNDVIYQAEKLLDYLAKPGADEDRWWASKDFTDEQRAQIERAVHTIEGGDA